MKICGIVAEYNPFHNGHQFLIEQARKAGATHVVAVMSGNFVQRGEAAVFSKWARTRACLENGADLVIELPVFAALSPAPDFARISIRLLHELGVQMLSFGSECGDVQRLREVLKCCRKVEQTVPFRTMVYRGTSPMQAREQLVAKTFGEEMAAVLREPNNILGLEYMRALSDVKPHIEPFTVGRAGVAHDSTEANGRFASASLLRQMLMEQGVSSIRDYVPSSAYAIYEQEIAQGKAPCRTDALDSVLCYRLRTTTAKELRRTAGIVDGLEHRILEVGKTALSMEECVEQVCTKQYTKARIRRILLNFLLNIEQFYCPKEPEYIRVMGANERGLEVLHEALIPSDLWIAPKFADIYSKKVISSQMEARATDVYSMCSPVWQPRGREFTEQVCILK